MASTRLPGKVLRPILGRPMLERIIERLGRAQCVDQIVVATTVNRADDPIAELARTLGVAYYRGSEEDVLDRVLQAARSTDATTIVEITGDSPLVDPGVIDTIFTAYCSRGVDYASNTLKLTYPLGVNAQVFAVAVLEEVASLTTDPADREHVSLYIYEHPERYSLCNVDSGLAAHYAGLRLTVDTPEDFALAEAIYQELYPANPAFALADVLKLLDARPALADMNRHVVQKRAR